ncbi:zinc-dependent amidohydrolase, putative [Syntrophotalea carbinolica DSM 2380]|uniref:Zinc-dependent amidohydrolase, putative n=1 Tax=Syntrophotalea carbinolica (strain DSM 2380 / NBRC 103641 / GraBd1) TaxID=338963 RepID=Q3A3W0_SYNC1|nr:amidohydrolase [Syntrophotalea carbinolica]ABA88947.1 zinc-dependent amidohydrolase, putative [Syntrophotalea carbinolica DSM 2380]
MMSGLNDLPPQTLNLLIDLRRQLHSCAEPPGREVQTRELLKRFFKSHAPQWVCQEYAGGSMAMLYEGTSIGPTLLVRCELDAVPLALGSDEKVRAAHRCGHDGHMAILAGLALALQRKAPMCGRIVLLFQAAEENGMGALTVCKDERFIALRPEFILGLHNLPGWPLGQVVVRAGSMCCASRGLEVVFTGQPGHASYPELGVSAAMAVSRLIQELENLDSPDPSASGMRMATIIGARLGEKHFGSIPDRAEVWATLRTDTNEAMTRWTHDAVDLVRMIAEQHGLQVSWNWQDVFPVVSNDKEACVLVRRAAGRARLSVFEPKAPFRWSEDFAHYAAYGRAAMVGLGSGETCATLHSEDYVFPDALIPAGVSLLYSVVQEMGI